MKYLLFIGDGMADEAQPSLGGKTPIEYAAIPAIDALAKKGVVGSVNNCPEGMRAGSDTAILSIFGYDPRRYYTGRAPLEAADFGIALHAGEIAYRCNMVTLEDGNMPFAEKCLLSHSADSVDGESANRLLAALLADGEFAAKAQKIGLCFTAGHSFRHIAVQRGVRADELRLHPPGDHQGEPIGPLLPAGGANAAALREIMRLAHEKLDRHPINAARRAAGKAPANGIWLWAAGSAAALPDFETRFGKKGGVISAVPLCRGIAALAGLERVRVEGATGETDTNLENKVAATLATLETYDFAALHVEVPDECTHNGDLAGKVQSIEWLSRRCMAPLVEAFTARGWDYRILFLSDHLTLSRTRGHAHGAVPFLLYDSRVDTLANLAFSEENGRKGPFYPDGADSCMKLLFEL